MSPVSACCSPCVQPEDKQQKSLVREGVHAGSVRKHPACWGGLGRVRGAQLTWLG